MSAVATRTGNGGVVVPSDPITLGNVLAASGFFADSRDAAQAAVKVMAGQELGFGPIASMTGIYIVKGRVTISANLMAAAIKRQRPRYDYRVVSHTEQECEVVFLQDGEEIGRSKYTMADATSAGLAGSDTWKKHPRNMLFARAMSNGAKWYTPDVFGGGPIYTPDELGAEINGETGDVTRVPDEPQPAALPAPAGQVPPKKMGPKALASLTAAITGYIEADLPSERLDLKLTELGASDSSDIEQALAGMSREQGKTLHDWLAAEIDAARDATADTTGAAGAPEGPPTREEIGY